MTAISTYATPAISAIFGGAVAFAGLQLQQDKITSDYAERIRETEIRLEQALTTNDRLSGLLTKTVEDIKEVRKAAQSAASPGLEALNSLNAAAKRIEELEAQLKKVSTSSDIAQFDAIESELDELKSQIARLAAEAGGGDAAADLPSAEDIAAVLVRDFAATLQGPAGQKGERGPEGLPGRDGVAGQAGSIPPSLKDQLISDVTAKVMAQLPEPGTAPTGPVSSIKVDKIIAGLDCLELNRDVKAMTAVLGWGGSVCYDSEVILSLNSTNGCRAGFSTPKAGYDSLSLNTKYKYEVGPGSIQFIYGCREVDDEYVYPIRVTWLE